MVWWLGCKAELYRLMCAHMYMTNSVRSDWLHDLTPVYTDHTYIYKHVHVCTLISPTMKWHIQVNGATFTLTFHSCTFKTRILGRNYISWIFLFSQLQKRCNFNNQHRMTSLQKSFTHSCLTDFLFHKATTMTRQTFEYVQLCVLKTIVFFKHLMQE